MSTDFNSLLKVDASKIEKPKPLPPGTYTASIASYEFGEANNANKTPFCRVQLQPISAEADVDTTDLGDLSKRKLRYDFWLTEDSLYRFTDFFKNVLQLDIAGRMLEELVPQMSGQIVKVEVTHVPSKDGQEVYAVANKLLAA